MDNTRRFGRWSPGSSPGEGIDMKNQNSKIQIGRFAPCDCEAIKKNQKYIFLSFFLFCFLFLISFQTQAAGLIPCGGKGQNPCQLCDFLVLFQNIVNFLLFKIVPPVAALMIVIGGIMFFMGGASPGMLQKAKSLLTSVAIGLVIIYGAWVFVNTFFMLIGLSQFGEFGFDLRQWWKFPCP